MPTYVVILRVKGSRSPRVVLYGVYSESGIDRPVRGDGSRLDKQGQKNAFKGPLLDLGPSSALLAQGLLRAVQYWLLQFSEWRLLSPDQDII